MNKYQIFNMKRFLSFLLVLLYLSCVSCSSQLDKSATSFVKGADVGWLPQMEATGYLFLDQDGVPKDGLQLLKDSILQILNR